MNQEKAREFFSSYHEGTLEPGLKQALEQAISRDTAVRDDYRNFERAYEDLGKLKFETIEIPFDLNDKILANIDRHIFENRRNQQPSWIVWLRNAAIAGVSCVAILGAALSLRNLTGKSASAGSITVGSTKEELVIEPSTNHEATIHFSPSQDDTLVIREGLNGKERRRKDVAAGTELTTTLENPTTEAAAYDIETPRSDTRSTLIILPGTSAATTRSGKGTLEDFAKALASFYRVPVEVHVASPTRVVSWNLGAPDALNAASGTLDLTRYAITWRMNNLLVISEL